MYIAANEIVSKYIGIFSRASGIGFPGFLPAIISESFLWRASRKARKRKNNPGDPACRGEVTLLA
jgi:hypothetical protein